MLSVKSRKAVRRRMAAWAAAWVMAGAHAAWAEDATDPYSQSKNVVDRVKEGPRMITDQLEYVAASSFTSLHISYNIFVHPKLSKSTQLGELHPDRILAEERMASESTKLCSNHLRANECYVFLWANLNMIPPGDISFVREGMKRSNGLFKWNKGGGSVFTWRSDAKIAETAPEDDAPLVKAEDDEAYQRDVRASNRFLEGAKMVGEDLEFISAESVVRMSVLYHVYIHPKLLRNMRAPKLSAEQLAAEKEIVEQSQLLCDKYKKTDECVILLWGSLESIPLDAKQNLYKDFMGQAQGAYISARGRRPSFEWRD